MEKIAIAVMLIFNIQLTKLYNNNKLLLFVEQFLGTGQKLVGRGGGGDFKLSNENYVTLPSELLYIEGQDGEIGG